LKKLGEGKGDRQNKKEDVGPGEKSEQVKMVTKERLTPMLAVASGRRAGGCRAVYVDREKGFL
jgi:hypothetical protein